MEPAVFLDRDNTLIANDGDLGDPEDVRLLGGVPEGLKALREAGYRLIVVTNQGGVARGVYTEDDVDAVHQRIAMMVDESAGAEDLIDRFYYCPYHPKAKLEEYRRDHSWRKPQPGMLLQAARDMKLDLGRCWMIGDQERDIAAGRAAGCRTIKLPDRKPGTDAGADEHGTESAATTYAGDFTEAVRTILKSTPARETATDDAPILTPRRPNSSAAPPNDSALRDAISELTEELRSERQRRVDFTAFRLAAGLLQLFAILLALLGLLQLDELELFVKWTLSAVMVQLLTIAVLLVDLKG